MQLRKLKCIQTNVDAIFLPQCTQCSQSTGHRLLSKLWLPAQVLPALPVSPVTGPALRPLASSRARLRRQAQVVPARVVAAQAGAGGGEVVGEEVGHKVRVE